jgi:ABC-type transport system substrate-binding protein
LIKKAEVEVDAEKRKALFKQVVTKLVDDSPIFPLGFTPRFFTFRDYVKGFNTNASGDFQPFIGGLSRAWIDK